MVVEEKAVVEQAVQEILELLRNQNVYNVSRMQESIEAIEHRFAVSMGIILALEITALVLAVGAGLYVLLKRKHG